MAEKADNEGRSNLHHAVVGRFTNLVHSLLEQQEAVNTPDGQGKTPLHLACSNIEGKDVPLFLKSESEDLPCRTLMETEKIIELLLSHGADPQSLDKTGKSPFHCLVDHWLSKQCPLGEIGHKIITLFMQCGANINGKDGNGRTPLHYVAGSAEMKVPRVKTSEEERMLMFRRASSRPEDKKKTRVKNTSENDLCRKEFLLELLKNGADIDTVDNKGCTPLHLAIEANQFNVVKELLMRKPNVNIRNIVGQTPLYHAVSSSDRFKHCAILLLHKGALANTVDNKRHTPLDIVEDREEFPIFLKHLILLISEKMHPMMKIRTEEIQPSKKQYIRECKDLNAYFEYHGQSQLSVFLRSHSLPVYTEDDFFISKMNSDGFARRFSNYSGFLKYKFAQDKNRRKMIENCTSVFSCFGGCFHYSRLGRLMYTRNTHWEALPQELKVNILSYLSSDDLEYLEKHLI